jgi:hypothetical protein
MLCASNPSVRGVLLALKKQNMQYNYGTFEVAVVLDDGILRDLSQEFQIKLIYFLFASGTSFK